MEEIRQLASKTLVTLAAEGVPSAIDAVMNNVDVMLLFSVSDLRDLCFRFCNSLNLCACHDCHQQVVIVDGIGKPKLGE